MGYWDRDWYLEEIKKVAKKIGRTPMVSEFVENNCKGTYLEILKIFGSWDNALSLAELEKYVIKRKVYKGYEWYEKIGKNKMKRGQK